MTLTNLRLYHVPSPTGDRGLGDLKSEQERVELLALEVRAPKDNT
jgi:hypothetical protein